MPPSQRSTVRLTGGPVAHPEPLPVIRPDDYVTLYAPPGAASAASPPASAPPASAPASTPPASAPAVRAPAAAPVAAPRRGAPDGAWPVALWGESPDAAREEPVIDFGQLRELLGYPWRALRRSPRLAAGVAAAVFAAAVLVLLVAPRQYDVETSILAQRNFVMPALGNPRRSVPAESDAPTRMAAEAVLNRQNLLDIIDEVGLEARWTTLRSPAGRAKDAVRAAVKGPVPADERRELLVNYLRAQLWVVADEGTVRIGVHFPDPRLALQIVQVAQRNFLGKRNASEQALIRESIGILETHVAHAHDQIDGALADVRRFTPAERRPAFRGLPAAAPRRRPSGAAAAEGDLGAQRAALADAEASRAQGVRAAQGRLADLRRTLGPAHPDVVAAQHALDALGAEAPELAALRAAVRDAEARVVAAGGSTAAAAPRAAAPSEASLASAALVQLAAQAADTLEDPRLTYARSRLKIAVADYEDLLDRLDGARIELETARAAFKYRYSIITPPQLPTRLAKPKAPLLLAGGLFAAAVLATFVVVGLELGSGRVVEGWQVSRLVGVPVIGEAPPA